MISLVAPSPMNQQRLRGKHPDKVLELHIYVVLNHNYNEPIERSLKE